MEQTKRFEVSGIQSTMTIILRAHFKILSNGKNPFEKQKQWGKAKKDKEEFRDPIVYFPLEIATDKEPEDLLSRIIHEWQRRGGIPLWIKELQSLESDTILAFYNIFTTTPKKYNILQEFCAIFLELLSMTQELDSTEFFLPRKIFQTTALSPRWSSASRTPSSPDKTSCTLVK